MIYLKLITADLSSKKHLLMTALLSMITLGATAQINAFPYYEDFETPGNWYAVNMGDPNGWEWGPPQGFVISSAHSGSNAWVTNLDGQHSNSTEAFLVSTQFDFTTFTNDPLLTFYLYYDLESCCDRGSVEYSVDGGITWSVLGSDVSGGRNWYNTNSGWGGYSQGWLPSSHILSGLAGQPSVHLRFRLYTDVSVTYEGIAIDDISIVEPSADIAVTGVEAPAKLALTSSEQIGFTVQALYFTVDAFDVTVEITGPLSDLINESYSSINLTAGSEATFYIEDVDFSVAGSYEVIVTITTSDFAPENNSKTIYAHHLYSKVSTFPYYEDFETNSGGWLAQNLNENGWEYGEPQGEEISFANSGDNAWITNLDGYVSANSIYYLYSPEFDFSSFTFDPIISFYSFRDLQSGFHNALVEYSTDGGTNWQMLGGYGTGERWYNTSFGWWGNTYGWTNHKHILEGLAGEPSVLLRIVLTSDSYVMGVDGLGLDDMAIRLPEGPDVFVSSVDLSNVKPLGTNETITLSVGSNFAPATELLVNIVVGGPMEYEEQRYFSPINIPAGGKADVEIGNLDFSKPGTYYLVIEVVTTGDEFIENNFSYWSFFNSNGVQVSSFPYHEYFEADDGDWFGNANPFSDNAEENKWEHGVPSSHTINTAHSGSQVWKTNLDDSYVYGGQFYLYSPQFDFSSHTEDLFISVFINYDHDVYDFTRIHYSFDGEWWSLLDDDGDGVQNWHTEDYGWTENSGGWLHAIHPLTDLAGAPSVFFRIEFIAQTYASNSFDGVAIDDISVGTLEEVTNPPVYVPPSPPVSGPGEVTAIDEENLRSGIVASPNPVTNMLTIDLGYMVKNTNSTVQVTDTRGLVISEHRMQKGQSQLVIDTSSMSEGLYMVWISSGNKKVCQKVIKSSR